MSDLVVVGFQGEDMADQVLNKLLALQSVSKRSCVRTSSAAVADAASHGWVG
jgi:uncharacterized membrane protein